MRNVGPMQESASGRTSSGRIPWNPALEGIRGTAVLLVLLFHYLRDADPHRGLVALPFKIAWAGWVGVDLFFVLSGYLITSILLASKGSERYFHDFYSRRIRRIFPLYYGSLAVVFLILPAVPALRTPEVSGLLRDQWYFWLYISNFMPGPGEAGWISLGHFWSLAIEEQFYLVWPAVILRTKRGTALRIALGALVLSVAFRAGLQTLALIDPSLAVARHWAFAWTPCRFDSLAAGAAIALLSVDPSMRRRLEAIARPLGVVAGTAVLWFVWRGLLTDALGAPRTPSYFALCVLVYTILAVAFGALVVEATRAEPSWLARALSVRPLRFLGKYSYGIYVYQGLLAPVLRGWLTQPRLTRWFGGGDVAAYATLVLSAIPILLLSVLSWHAYERRFLLSKPPARIDHAVSAP